MLDHRFTNGLVASAVLVLLLTSVDGSQSVTGNTIVGKVRTQSGHPVANVLIELQTGTGALVTQTFSTNEGDYAFSGLEGASFVLVVDDPSHQPFAERVELTRLATTRPGEMVRIDIVLTPQDRSKTPRGETVFHQDVPKAALNAYRRGVRLLAEHKSDDGIAALKKAIGIMPAYFDAHLALGLELFRLQRYDQAIQELEKARAANSTDSRLYHTFGLVLFEQKKYAMAARVLAEATRLNPANAEARLMRGVALIEIGNLNEAEANIKAADNISAHKLAIVHLHLARVYEKRGDRSLAADELEAYLRMKPRLDNEQAIRAAIRKLRTN
ncbi:MAG TPA: tetratricopeptide repeat protein [Blastocatellia bacterium]|nr:tetratricopeptide repeat protein [Blastocatellia bacterium]